MKKYYYIFLTFNRYWYRTKSDSEYLLSLESMSLITMSLKNTIFLTFNRYIQYTYICSNVPSLTKSDSNDLGLESMSLTTIDIKKNNIIILLLALNRHWCSKPYQIWLWLFIKVGEYEPNYYDTGNNTMGKLQFFHKQVIK